MADEINDDEFFDINPDEIVKVIDLDDVPVPHRAENCSSSSDDDEDDDETEMETDEALSSSKADDSKLTFTGHKNTSVICCQICPTNNELAVTGGQDDIAYVWNTKDGSILLQCTGHTDTVSCVGFSHNGSMVATADMKGLVKVWKVDTGAEIWSFEVSDVEWLQWHHLAPVLLVGTKDGQVWMWKIPAGDVKIFAGYGPSAVCGKIPADGSHVCVGYDDGVVKIWDLKSASAQHTISGYDGHKSSVFCMDVNTSSTLVMTGSNDMTAKVINMATGKVVSSFQCGDVRKDGSDEEDSVEAVGFCCVQDYAATGTLGGRLDIWDVPTRTLRQKCSHPHGIVKLIWSKTSPVFHTACLDGIVRSYDARSGLLYQSSMGHSAGVLDFSLDSNESMIVTASDDSTARVFSVHNESK